MQITLYVSHEPRDSPLKVVFSVPDIQTQLNFEIANGQQNSFTAESDLIQRRLASTLKWPHYKFQYIYQLSESCFRQEPERHLRSMIHWIVQFTPHFAVSSVLHRSRSQEICNWKLSFSSRHTNTVKLWNCERPTKQLYGWEWSHSTKTSFDLKVATLQVHQ